MTTLRITLAAALAVVRTGSARGSSSTGSSPRYRG